MDSLVIEKEAEVAPVSVIVPCYRCADTVERALDSIVRQTMRPSELLLVEDASADEGRTLKKLQEFVTAYDGKIRIQILCVDTNGGPGKARNFGWAHALQPYIAFLDADDAWHRHKIEIQYRWMKAHPDVALSCHESIFLTDREREPLLEKDHVPVYAISAYRMLFLNSIPTRSVMLKTSVNERFSDGMRYAEDYDLWLRIVFSSQKACRLRLPMAFSFKGDFGVGGLSGNLHAMQDGEKKAYKNLLSAGHIGYLLYISASIFSRIKYWRRMLIMFISSSNANAPT